MDFGMVNRLFGMGLCRFFRRVYFGVCRRKLGSKEVFRNKQWDVVYIFCLC